MQSICRFLALILLISGTMAAAQDRSQSTNSLFDVSEVKTYAPRNILVQGEVQDPGIVDLGRLPIRNTPVKELALENGKQVFKGAFFVSGYALYDILSSKKVKKAPEDTFSPLVDMYAVVENDKGEKAVFSWGEIFYRDSFNILIAKSIQSINPAKIKTSWPLPAEPQLICANDLLSVRFLSNPTKITVLSYHGSAASEKPKDVYSPEIRVVAKRSSAVIRDIGPSIEKRHYESVHYGHGMGFKGVQTITGYLLKNLISANGKITPENLRQDIAVVSAKDGYRAVFSMSEIMNRNDNQDFLLNDLKDSPKEGRYTLIAPDFFVDRNVKGIEKMEFINID
jgi:hypothetical protein